MIRSRTVMSFLILLFLCSTINPATAQEKAWWPKSVEMALQNAGDNRPELETALNKVPENQRKGMAFLIQHMPTSDLRSLKADFLLENVRLSYKAREEFSWARNVPEEIFLNDVLPYANVNEERDPWRKEMYEMCQPIVKDCKTASEAVDKLNKTIFPKLKVRYSTKRRKPHQSPKESIEIGMASCTGLSILLSDACRSVGIPARLAGTPLWSNKSGNHTWLEVWDNGWHFTGACEPDGSGKLNRGWFAGRAAEAQKDSRVHAIYAASFKKTETSFPLVWSPRYQGVYAENVTDRYAKPKASQNDTIKVLVRVRRGGKRVSVPVIVRNGDKEIGSGKSRNESNDTNDLLTFQLKKDHSYVLLVGQPVAVEKEIRTSKDKEMLVDINLPISQETLQAEYASASVKAAALKYFQTSKEERAKLDFAADLDSWVVQNPEKARTVVWQAYKEAKIHKKKKENFDKNEVRSGSHVSPYTVKSVGKRPKGGWPLFIAMHGGGGAPQRVNDSQWNIMKIYYKDQPSVTGYKYLALRAPNNTWNGFYDLYVPGLIMNLIEQMVLFADVDPNKVFIMGYSHGGYGAFYIGPKIPDRFAAVHVSAAAPTDGTISPRSLMNTRFTFMIGENDTAYGRRDRCQRFAKQIADLKKDAKDLYPVDMEFKKGFGHGGLPDRDKIKEMYSYTRNPVPKHIIWDMTDSEFKHFFWLEVPSPKNQESVEAQIEDNNIVVTTKDTKKITLWLDNRLIDIAKPVNLKVNGQERTVTLRPSLQNLCQSMADRADPYLAFSCRLDVTTKK